MSAIYDNWERLVAAVLKKQQLWELFHDHSRSPSILSEASDFSSPLHHLASDSSSPGSSSKLQKSHSKLVLISDFSPPAFNLKDVHLASADLLGRGTFASAYKATMDNGARIVVKRLKSVGISELDFKRYMEIIGDVRHENVVPLRAYYSSKDEKLMLYDYCGNGSTYSLLHGQIGESQAHVDWGTRLKIAIGAARGIAEIHKQLGGMLVHGNIKASNVFLNLQLYGCVSDLGFTNMTRTTFMPTARCYAPEVKNTQNVSHASDVYSFGILLLELLTRKPTVHVPRGPAAIDLVKLVSSVKNKGRAAKVFDPELLKHPTLSKQMVKMLQIGFKCVAKSIKKRPLIFEVVNMLEDIITSAPIRHALNPVSQLGMERKLVFIEDVNPPFELEHLLKSSAEVLGQGTFGTCYKVILENGNATVVKRLRDVIVTTLHDFQHHMEIFGTMKHKNVGKLRAYHFSSEEKLLVYDYYNQGSLSALLHGKEGAPRTPVDWETRMQIAVDAARGIAHVHMQDGQKLVHGNIKSSNIFLYGQNFSFVSDAGIAKLMSPIRLPSMLSPGYCAPEIADTREVSQASDVYSFGVVLLELVSGRPSQHNTDDGDVVSVVHWIRSVVRNEWTAEVFDAECLGDKNKEAMAKLLGIAMDCVSIVPEQRPRMLQVVKVLEEISGVEPSNQTLLEDARGKSSVESTLEYLLPVLSLLTPQ